MAQLTIAEIERMGGRVERAHALLAPSAAKRWLNCTPSARATEHLPDDESDFAAEGTLGHTLAELYLHAWLDSAGIPADYELDTLRTNRLWSQELEDAALEYVALVQERYARALSIDPSAEIRIERRVDLSDAVPESFGKVDCRLTYGKTLEVVDAKFGKGVYVSAQENPQTRLYAYGALKDVEILWIPEEVVCTICQPRIDNVQSETLTRQELLDWVWDYVHPRAQLAFEGHGEFKAGSWCTDGFCKIRRTCKARVQQRLEEVKVLFTPTRREAATMTSEEVAAVLPAIEDVARMCSDIKKHALTLAVQNDLPGYKAVEGRGRRVVTDCDGLVECMAAAGVDRDLLYERELKGITKLSQLVGKKKFDTMVEPYVAKQPGRPTLVPEDDRRQAIRSVEEVAAMFAAQPLESEDE